MASTFCGLRQMVDNFIAGEESSSDESDYLPPIPSTSGKRKASNDLDRELKSPRYTRPIFTTEDYASSDFWEGAAERRSSKATMLAAGPDTYLVDSGTESGIATPEPPHTFSIFNRKKALVRAGSPAKRASPERVREGRIKFWDKLQSTLGTVMGGVEDVIEEADEAGIDHTRLSVDLQRAKNALQHAQGEAEDLQAGIEDVAYPSLPIEETQPSSPEAERPPILSPAAPPSRRRSSNVQSAWVDTPIARAHRILRHSSSLVDAATKINAELTEPQYAYRDIEIRDTMWQIMDQMERFAHAHFNESIARSKKELAKAFQKMEPETVKIIGCVASGGPGGDDGWRELFWDEQKRRALVCAIVGNVLVQQVFEHPCFGGSEELLAKLRDVQEDMQDEDGFTRNTAYAIHIRRHLFAKETIHLPPNFAHHVSVIVTALTLHLSPILSLFSTQPASTTIRSSLTSLVTAAGIFSLQMRLDPHTVYYHTPMFKEDTFQSKYMEAFNKMNMEKTHPRQPTTIWPADTPEAEKQRAKSDDPLTQMVLMYGLTAYRKGGWETKESSIWDPVYARVSGAEKGIRARVLVQGWVYCRWGRARMIVDGKNADDVKVHGTAWKQPGFVEFRSLKGVPDPNGDRGASRASKGVLRRV